MKTFEICGGLGSFETTDNICPFCGGTIESTSHQITMSQKIQVLKKPSKEGIIGSRMN
jgi:hypothetical protein